MSYEEFEEEVKVLGNLKNAFQLLGWDEEVMMPKNGVKPRSQQKSTLNKIQHERLTSDKLGKLIESTDKSKLNEDQEANLREIKKERERMTKVSPSLVKKISQKESECVNVWKNAKAENDFESFAKELKELVELKREYANQINSDKEPYRVLFEDFEPYITYERMEEILEELKQNLTPMIEEIQSKNLDLCTDAFKGEFDDETEIELNKEILDEIGFDNRKARLDLSEHPFTIGNSFDTRITSRTIDGDLKGSIMPTVHEMGHAFYNLGLPEEHYATPRGEPRELPIHESQSRLWENHVGRSKEFWKYFLPKLQNKFPSEFTETTVEDCYESVNQVYDDNMIRVEADELTYHLHIIIRFEVGKALINAEIEVEDLPEEWNKRMEQYLGLTPENNAEGVMQDIHWAWGSFGYFPTYTLGSVIAAQLYQQAEQEIDGLDGKIESGNFKPLLKWLRENIHRKGKLIKTEKLVQQVTGNKPSSEPFLEHIEEKYSRLYNL